MTADDPGLDAEVAGGDPAGRRLARRRALLLAEAGAVAGALRVLLNRAGVPVEPCERLCTDIARAERSALMKSDGRIEARQHFKRHASHPLLENRTRSLLFVDESGRSSPDPGAKPAFFALAAVAIEESAVADYRIAADQIKTQFFGSGHITFHEPGMRNHEGIYWFNGDKRIQVEFEASVNQLIEATPFVAFGVGVRKHAFRQ